MLKCEQCGGRVRRVHRTFFERFSYMAIYECRDCDTRKVLFRATTRTISVPTAVARIAEPSASPG